MGTFVFTKSILSLMTVQIIIRSKQRRAQIYIQWLIVFNDNIVGISHVLKILFKIR